MVEVVTGVEELLRAGQELKTHRAQLVIPHEDLFRLAGANPAYVVLGVHTDFITDRVVVVVAHPDLAAVHPGCEPPVLRAHSGMWTEIRVIDGELYRRTEMEIGPPGELGRPVTAEVREQLRARLQEVLDTYAPEHQLEAILVRLAEAAASGVVPFSAAKFLEWLR